MILWPAILHHAGQAELTYLENQPQWQREAQLQAFRAGDRLIDSSGSCYTPAGEPGRPALPQPSAEAVSLDELIALVRAHAAQAGHCCVAKLSAGSIEQALRLVATLQE